jgi:hypothetical protein
MFIDFKPITTTSELLKNNTSASDTFAGWVNGNAAARRVSGIPLSLPQLKLVHRCDWWGGTNHPNIGINCADPVYCAKTAADMKARGLDGCFLDWYGLGHNTDKSLLVLRPELEKQGLKFSLCVDAGTPAIKKATTDADRTTALLATLAYARKTYFSSPAYARVGGKPLILFFGFATGDFDWTKIRAAMADCLLIFRWELNYSNRSYADGYFGWTHCDEAWVADVKKRAPGKLIVLGINGGFDSSHKEDPIRCSWGSGNIIAQNGGLHLQDQFALAAAHPEIPILSINTWNDYQEGSELETGIKAADITLSKSGSIVSWGTPSAAYDHIELHVSQDGINTMPFALARGVTSVDLATLDFAPGKYTFYVYGVGKPFIQNTLSNPVIETLTWS